MKTIIVALAAAALTGFMVYNMINEKHNTEFDTYKSNYQVMYKDVAEEQYRKMIFEENLKKINEHNSKQSDYTLGVNQFTDKTFEELSKYYLTDFENLQGENKCEKTGFTSTEEISRVDWEKKGHVQQVKNQAQCGSCWAFAAVGGLESAYSIFKKELPNLSEQELVDCSTSYGNFGCSGGLMGNAYDYVLDHKLNTQKDYPYRGVDQQCKNIQGKYSLKGCKQIPMGVKNLTEALKKQPTTVAFYVQSDFFSYKSGVYNPEHCNSHPNHGVLAVGFDLRAKLPFYRVKNSWGKGWGEEGYFKIAIGKDHGTCNIAGTEWNYIPVV